MNLKKIKPGQAYQAINNLYCYIEAPQEIVGPEPEDFVAVSILYKNEQFLILKYIFKEKSGPDSNEWQILTKDGIRYLLEKSFFETKLIK